MGVKATVSLGIIHYGRSSNMLRHGRLAIMDNAFHFIQNSWSVGGITNSKICTQLVYKYLNYHILGKSGKYRVPTNYY